MGIFSVLPILSVTFVYFVTGLTYKYARAPSR